MAVELAASGLTEVEHLILCATFARSPRPSLIRLSKYLPAAALMRLPFPRFILRPFVSGGRESVDALMDLWLQVKKRMPPEAILQRLHLINTIDVRQRLSRLTMPCLCIQAAHDRTVPAACLADFIGALPDLRVCRIEGPHFILQARPGRCLAAIEAFLGGGPAGT